MNKDFDGKHSDMRLDPEYIRALGYRIVDIIVRDLADPTRRPPFPPLQSIERLESILGGPLPRRGMDPEEILRIIEQEFLPASGNHNHPCLMANVLTGSLPLSGLIEALVGTIKVRPTTWRNQPASCQVEITVARWLGEITGFSSNAAGYITSGGSWANLVGLAMARVRCAGWNIRAKGCAGREPLTVYTSEEAHSCFDRSVELMGVGRELLRKVPTDSGFRVRTDLIEDAIQNDLDSGFRPFCVVGQAGTINTGAVDDLRTLADIAHRYGLWFHIDGSYGALAALNPEARHLFAGIDRADSLCVDPHKWLNTPFEAGCILARTWSGLRDTFGLLPPYMRSQMGEAHDQYEYGFELSRTDRALKVWVALKQYGADCYARMIAGHMALARHMAVRIAKADDLELVSEPVLSTCCFRYVPPGIQEWNHDRLSYLNDLNRAIENEMSDGCKALVSGTDVRGTRVLRACIASYQVTREAVDTTLETVRSIGQRLDECMRSGYSKNRG
ncbi:MAG: pyridoxal phosphate-dependent decarboxylase family protein [bacterium]